MEQTGMVFSILAPDNMRPHQYDTKQTLRQILRSQALSFVRRILIVSFLLVLGTGLYIQDWRFFTQGYNGLIFFSLYLVFIAISCGIFVLESRKALGKDRSLQLPYYYGYDKNALYGFSENVQSRILWNFYSSWRETEDIFILEGPRGPQILPKTIWSPQETEEIRSLLSQHAR